jgi:hypothetical protein
MLSPHEVAFFGPRVFVPPGAAGIALLADDESTYTPNVHAGEHGGATLAEVVAPCLLLGCADHAVDPARPDPALTVRAPFVPAWWHFDVRDADNDVDVSVVKKSATARAHRPAPSLGLFGSASEPPSTPTSTPPPATAPDTTMAAAKETTSPLSTSAVLKAQVKDATFRQRVVAAVDALSASQGVLSAEAFARATHELPFRIPGFVAKLQEALNIDGYQVLSFDPTSKQVRLDRAKLEQLFEVTL